MNKAYKIICYIGLLIILIMLISLPILSYLEIWKFETIFSVAEDVANFLYLISGFLLVFGLLITFLQLKVLKVQVSYQLESTQKELEFIKEDMRTRNERAAVEKSIDYLNMFANEILPKMEKYMITIGDEKLKINNWDPSATDYKIDLFSLPKQEQLIIFQKIDIRYQNGLLGLLNNIEFFSAGVIHGLAKENVVYEPIANAFITFVSNEIIEISSQRHLGVPFENTIKLYNKWKLRKKAEAQALQVEEMERIMEIKKAELEAAAAANEEIAHIGKL